MCQLSTNIDNNTKHLKVQKLCPNLATFSTRPNIPKYEPIVNALIDFKSSKE